ncbi:MAG: YciI family protein [Actinomycetota bacterium]|nr:YciI family protein [Actinomycetota bacterium]
MPQYMLLIYGPSGRTPSPEEMAVEMPRWQEYTEGLQNAGIMRAGDALHGADSATTVRVRDGETQVTDGPFAETKETLGGYYVIECPDLDTALKHAARMPNITYGSVEVRPVVDFSAAPAPGEPASATA